MSTRPQPPGIAGAVLCGGRSSRFGGQPKGMLQRDDGTTLVAHLLQVMAGAGIAARVIVANPPHPYATAGTPVIADLQPGLGPLAGLEAALEYFASAQEAVLFLPCDLPAMTVDVINCLTRAYLAAPGHAVVAQTPLGWQPLCAIVPVAWLPEVRQALADGLRAPWRLWQALAAKPVRFEDPAPFCNVNTPEQWHNWQRDQENYCECDNNRTC